MNPTILLTVFLLVAGILTVVCAVFRYEWFFNTWEFRPARLIATIGQKQARLLFILIGLACLTWGVIRIVNPPPEIPTDFLYEIAKPGGIDLMKEGALEKLKAVEGIDALEVNGSEWASFRTLLPTTSPHFAAARDAAAAGPDFPKGFHLGNRVVDGSKIEGRKVHFDSESVICDNGLFTNHPLDSAAFVLVIGNEETSGGNGLKLIFARVGTNLYRLLDK